MLLRGTQSPESDGASAKLREPALQLGLRSIVREPRHMQHLAPFREEGPNIGSSVHRAGQNVRVLVGGLRLPNQPTEDAGESDRLLHSPTGRGRGEGLQVEGQVMLDGSARLDRLNLESSAYVAQHGGPER